jgi:hypothetical protein
MFLMSEEPLYAESLLVAMRVRPLGLCRWDLGRCGVTSWVDKEESCKVVAVRRSVLCAIEQGYLALQKKPTL